MAIRSVNPKTGEVEQTFEPLDAHQIHTAVDRADEAYRRWRDTSVADRAELLRNVARDLRDNADTYARIMTSEMGKLLREGVEWELPNCADICDYYADNAARFLADAPIDDVTEGLAHVETHPIGVIFGVMPWNFPFYQVIRFIAPNVMAGNTVLFKHASNVPQAALAVERVFRNAGFPEGVVSTLLMDSSDTELVIGHDAVRAVSLTGSERAGAAVASLAGAHLKKAVMELGGSDAFIVTEDVDLDQVVDLAFEAKMFNCGEVCTGAKRFIVHASVYDAFLTSFAAKMSTVQAGDPLDPATGYGPMVSEKEAAVLHEVITTAQRQGATIVTGGNRLDREGAWLEPTVITDVTPEMDIYSLELFGPAAMVFKVEDDRAAIDLANDSPYGLASAVMSRDLARAYRIASALETGVTFVNSMVISEPALPLGGVKNSGFGRELGRAGMEEFVNKKLVRTL